MDKHLERTEPSSAVYLMDSDRIEELFHSLGDADKLSQADQELNLSSYKSLHFVAFAHGKHFSGLVPGALPHVQYQVEGTRVMAMASLEDAPWHFFWHFFGPSTTVTSDSDCKCWKINPY